MSDDKITIKFEHTSQLSTKITANNEMYFVLTEEQGNRSSQVCSRVYSKGKILFQKCEDISHLKGSYDFRPRLNSFMAKLQRQVADEFTDMLEKSQKKKAEYLQEARSLLKQGKSKETLDLLKKGLMIYPDDLLLLSYYGFLYSQVEKKNKEGIRICRESIAKLNSRVSANRELLLPVFYLNLGRAYIGADKKKEAFWAFNSGLRSDPTNADIEREIAKYGKRRPPVLTFLERDNPLNKYIGMLKGEPGAQ
jgi:tetratricopeptide (TPR) repeat protein